MHPSPIAETSSDASLRFFIRPPIDQLVPLSPVVMPMNLVKCRAGRHGPVARLLEATGKFHRHSAGVRLGPSVRFSLGATSRRGGGMAKIGGGWLTSQEARTGEEVVYSRLANRMQGSRAVGGKLFLTDQRILFCPHRIDGLLAGKQWSVETGDVAEVGVEPKGSGKASRVGGGLRDRM